MYTTEFFTAEHAKFLGDLTADAYHTLAAKYTTTISPLTINVNSDTLAVELKSALICPDHVVLVDGVMHEVEGAGVMEKDEEFEKLVICAEKALKGMPGKYYIHILGPHKTAYPHPKMLKWLEEGKYTLESGFWAPGQQMPEQTLVVEVSAKGNVQMTTNLMCSVYSNFNTIPSKVTPRSLGCNPSIVPEIAMDVEILSAEHAIQFAKAIAALAFPEKYMNLEVSEADLAKAMGNVEKFRKPEPKRKLEGNKAEQIIAHCGDVYRLLADADKFETQKKLGQTVILTKAWFTMVAGTPVEAHRNFTAEDLQKFGANNVMQAFVIMARVAALDVAFYERLCFDIESNNVPVEAAMHDPVKADKATLAPGASKYLFGGAFPDRVWGTLCGSPRYTVKPDGLVNTDGKFQTGHLGNGAELVRQAMKGDQQVLDYFGLDAPLTFDTMGAGAAAALNKFWAMARE